MSAIGQLKQSWHISQVIKIISCYGKYLAASFSLTSVWPHPVFNRGTNTVSPTTTDLFYVNIYICQKIDNKYIYCYYMQHKLASYQRAIAQWNHNKQHSSTQLNPLPITLPVCPKPASSLSWMEAWRARSTLDGDADDNRLHPSYAVCFFFLLFLRSGAPMKYQSFVAKLGKGPWGDQLYLFVLSISDAIPATSLSLFLTFVRHHYTTCNSDTCCFPYTLLDICHARARQGRLRILRRRDLTRFFASRAPRTAVTHNAKENTHVHVKH